MRTGMVSNGISSLGKASIQMYHCSNIDTFYHNELQTQANIKYVGMKCAVIVLNQILSKEKKRCCDVENLGVGVLRQCVRIHEQELFFRIRAF